MKNKESFLKELQSRLAVLEEAEQQDILAEYAQHIDLRVAGGLTEEEAIRDFGDIDQLAAEILGAYHVRPTYRVQPTYQAPSDKKGFPSLRTAVRRGAAGVAAFFRRLRDGIAVGGQRLGNGVKCWVSRCKEQLKRLLSKRPGTEEAAEEDELIEAAEQGGERENPTSTLCIETENEEAKGSMEHTKKKGAALAALSRGSQRLRHGLWRLCRSAAWLAWNSFLLLCSLPFVCLGLLALMCLGALVVLLIQGYPLAGITLCCLGSVACCVGVLGLGSGLVWHRGKPAAIPEEPVTALVSKTVDETERGEVDEDVQQ